MYLTLDIARFPVLDSKADNTIIERDLFGSIHLTLGIAMKIFLYLDSKVDNTIIELDLLGSTLIIFFSSIHCHQVYTSLDQNT